MLFLQFPAHPTGQTGQCSPVAHFQNAKLHRFKISFWVGLPLVAAGFLLPRVIKSQAPRILLYLAQHDAKTYFEAMKFGILEVRHR